MNDFTTEKFRKNDWAVLGWLSDECTSPFADSLWQAVLSSAASDGQIKMSSDVIEATLVTAPTDCLFSRKRRRELSDVLISLISFIPGGEETLVRSILEFHKESVDNNSGICRLGKYHDITYVAVYLAELHQVPNSALISQLLNDIYKCENGFDRIVAPAVLGPKVSHILSSWRPDVDSVEKAQSILTYFIIHSTLSKLTFGEGNKRKRLLDVPLLSLQGTPPLTVAVMAHDVKAVKLLLQYGAELDLYGVYCPLRTITQKLSSYARFSLDGKCRCENVEEEHSDNSLKCIKHQNSSSNQELSDQQWMDLLYSTSFYSDPSYIMCDCQRFFEISWPEESVQILNLLTSCIIRKKIFKNPEYFHPRLFTDGLLDCKPPTLKHSARFCIRRRLHDNWNLPFGTHKLKLPRAIINYINFESV